jgi:hypothetical protein
MKIKLVKNHQNCQKLSKWSKMVVNCKKWSKTWKMVNNSSKLVEVSRKRSKVVKKSQKLEEN